MTYGMSGTRRGILPCEEGRVRGTIHLSEQGGGQAESREGEGKPEAEGKRGEE